MCRAITCSKCHKPTWAGCGAHIEQVLGHVPPADRCQCRAAASAAPSSMMSAIRKLFGGS